jgi:TrpR-related protein YerC/YecD
MISLYKAFSLIKSEREFNNFLTDLCTPDEIKNLRGRWDIAQLLYDKKLSQFDIAAKTNSGVATITRVARCLNTENANGYKTILNRIHHA